MFDGPDSARDLLLVLLGAFTLLICVFGLVLLRLRAEVRAQPARMPPAAGPTTQTYGPAELALVEQSATAAEPICLNCKWFEVEACQASLKKNPAFVAVMQIMSPYEHGKKVKYEDVPCPECDPKGAEYNEACPTCCGQKTVSKVKYVYPTDIALNARWEDYGWCTNEKVHMPNDRPYTECSLWGGKSNCDGKLFQVRPKKALPQLRAV